LAEAAIGEKDGSMNAAKLAMRNGKPMK